MKKRIISIFLCLVLAFALLPAAAWADYVNVVSVEVAVPLAGQTPSEVEPTVNSDLAHLYAYDWRYNGEKMSNWFDKFEKGKTYTLVVAVASPGDFHEYTRTYINGMQVQWTKNDDHNIRFSLDFTVTEEQLNDLTVTLPHKLPGTKMSKVAEDGVVEGTEGAVIQAIFWYLNGEEVAPQNYLKADTTYEARVRLYAREGYRFAVPLRVTCNSQTFDDISGDGETAYFKVQYSTDAKGQTAGEIDVEVIEPKTGEKPSHYAGFSGGGGFGIINNSDTVPWDYYQRGVEWYDLTAQTPQSYEDPFQEGHAYRVSIHCILNDGYEWPDPSLHRINGKAPTGIDQQGDKLTLRYDFPPIDSTATLKHVDAVRFVAEAPAVGQKPKKANRESSEEIGYDVYMWNSMLKQNGTRWFELDGNGNRVKELGENDVFEANKAYELELLAFCVNGYCFTDEALSNATINDQKVQTVRSDDKTEMTLTMVFPAITSSAKAIETVDIGVTAPVAGAHPVYAFTTGSPLLTPYPMSKEMEDLGMENSILWAGKNSKLPSSGTFAAGTDYTVMIYVQVDPGYYIPENAAVTINGAAPGDWGFNAEYHVLVLQIVLKAKQAKALASITVSAPPAKTVYAVGQSFDPAGMVVTATYDDKSTAEVTGWTVMPTALTANDTCVTISYTEGNVTKTTTQAVTVASGAVNEMSLTVTTPVAGATPVFAATAAGPHYAVFTESKEYINLVNGVGWIETDGPTQQDIINNGKIMTAADSFQEGKYYYVGIVVKLEDGYSFGKDLLNDAGAVTVNGSPRFDFGVNKDEGLVGAFFGPLQAAPKTLSNITITTPPAKTEYTAGQTFNPAGMVVTATYTDQTTAVVTGWTVTPTALTANDTSVTISYTEGDVTKTTTQAVTVKAAKTLSSIAVTVAPTKTTYTAGDAFDPAGMVVTASYTDYTSVPVAGYKVTPEKLSQSDSYVTISYTEGDVTKTATQAVTVKAPKTLVSIAIMTPPAKIEYTTGQSFAPAGMVVTATYSDESTAEVTGWTYAPDGALSEKDTVITVSYTEGDITLTAEQPITVTAAAKENPFSDVFESDYFYDAVIWAYYADPLVTNGYPDGTFRPTREVSRAEAVTFLWRAAGCPEPKTAENPFEDVKETNYFYKAVLWAVENGITKGTNATHFTPAQTCSTAHIITFLYRTLGVGDDGWGGEAKTWAEDAGLLQGLDIEVAPGVMCPRCNVVLFIYRALVE